MSVQGALTRASSIVSNQPGPIALSRAILCWALADTVEWVKDEISEAIISTGWSIGRAMASAILIISSGVSRLICRRASLSTNTHAFTFSKERLGLSARALNSGVADALASQRVKVILDLTDASFGRVSSGGGAIAFASSVVGDCALGKVRVVGGAGKERALAAASIPFESSLGCVGRAACRSLRWASASASTRVEVSV